MNKKRINPKKYFYTGTKFASNEFDTFQIVSSRLSGQGDIPRKKLIVPQNFGNDSPGGFLVKFFILVVSLFFGLAIMAIFLGEVLDKIFK